MAYWTSKILLISLTVIDWLIKECPDDPFLCDLCAGAHRKIIIH